MSNQILVGDRESILNSPVIQITHKHPDFAHVKRHDLDPEDLVLESYPILLAHKIVPFLDQATLIDLTTPRSRSTSFPPLSQISTAVSSKTRASSRKNSIPTKTIPTTPAHQGSLPLDHIPTPGIFDTSYTSRIISPGGRFLSPPETDNNTIPAHLLFSTRLSQADVPTAASTPPQYICELSSPKGLRKRRNPPGPPPLVEFDTEPRSVEGNEPKSTVVLRHDVSTRALKDVFEWSYLCLQEGRILGLEEWLMRFRDLSRAREISECCTVLKLEKLRNVAWKTVQKLCQFGDEDEEQVEFGKGQERHDSHSGCADQLDVEIKTMVALLEEDVPLGCESASDEDIPLVQLRSKLQGTERA